MPGFKDITGQRFGRLVAVKPNALNKHKRWDWEYICDCGNTLITDAGGPRSGNTRSCGCLRSEATSARMATHRKGGTPEHRAWAHMLRRCRSPDEPMYPQYGGRGIRVCDRWLKFENFLADMGEKPPGLSLDRIDVNGNYEPNNCRWATWLQQANNKQFNRRTEYMGETITITELARLTGLSIKTIDTRWCRGDRGEALYRPTDHGRRR